MGYTPKRGLNVPIVTVLDEQCRVIRHVLQEGDGADVIFANGTTGEWNRLPNAERQRLMEIAVDEVKQRRQQMGASAEIWLGVNGGTRAEVLANLELALQLGADAAVIAPLALEDLAEEEIVRPNLIGNPILPEAERTLLRWFNTAAFAAPAPLTYGTSSKTPNIQGPGLASVDFSLNRSFKLPRDGMKFELRGDFFNSLNRVNFNTPSGAFGNPNFGRVTSARLPRTLQFGAKFWF